MSTDLSNSPSEKSVPWKLIIIGLIIAVLFSLQFFLPIKEWMGQFNEWVESLGVWGPTVFIFGYLIFTIFLIPGSALTIGAGAIFGLGWGALYTTIGANLGANAAFLIGRYVARRKIEAKVKGNQKFAAIDDAVGKEGTKIVALTRLAPVFPFTLLNYAYGLTQVKWSSYAIATFFGMMPGTLLYVYIGTITRSLTGGTVSTPATKIFLTIGFIVTIIVTVFVTRKAQAALKEATAIDEEEEKQG